MKTIAIELAAALFVAGFSSIQAQQQCSRCHPSEVAEYQHSPMGESIGPPTVFQEGRVSHKLSNSVLTVRVRNATIVHRLERGGVSAEYPVAYSVGAGIVGYSYMVRLGRYLYQSPLSYYTQVRTWDLTPGYESDSRLDFTHQLSKGCLFCHTGSLNLVEGTQNQFLDPPFTPISCERCHGSTAAHLAHPSVGNIANPAKLANRERDSVCEQCHLEGNFRILGPDKDWWDFKVGQPTESTWTTFLESTDPVRAVSQAELLAQSQCAQKSGGKLWCATCHPVHSPKTDRSAFIRGVCMNCHQSLFTVGAHRPATECVTCHMPRLRPVNVSHAAVHDHSFPRRPRTPLRTDDFETVLRAWHEPAAPLVNRALGLAYFEQATASHSAADIRKAYEILSQLPAEQRKNAAVEADLASLLLQTEPRIAVDLFHAAAALEPQNARYAYVLGAALARTGRTDAALEQLKRAIQLDPSQLDPYLELSKLYLKAGRVAESRGVIEQFLKFMPQNIELRLK